MYSLPADCAREILAAVPLVMHTIRTEMRSQREPDLSVPQFRVLNYLNRHEGASLSEVAEFLGLTLPSVSKMVDGLVGRGLVSRQMAVEDRRRVVLAPTAQGRSARQAALQVTESRLAERLAPLPASRRRTIMEAMQVLASIFGAGGEAPTATRK
jgi:DNA-binding MarR family transcriptional regulator